MTLRTLLLGGAAAFLTVGAAQAADLGAEPANYVKVCDAFGPGYYYSPGTDTCIKIGGYVRFDAVIAQNSVVGLVAGTGTGNFYFHTRGYLTTTASTMTEYGPMVGYIALQGDNYGGQGAGTAPFPLLWPSYGPAGKSNGVSLDEAYLSLGPLFAGYSWTPFQTPGSGFTDSDPAGIGQFNGATKTNWVGLNWAMSGIGLSVGAVDYSTRSDGLTPGTMPDLEAALNFGAGPVAFHIAGGWGQRTPFFSNSWGATATANIDLSSVVAGARLLVGANYSANDLSYIWGLHAPGDIAASAVYSLLTGGSWYSVWGSLSVPLTSQLSAAVSGGSVFLTNSPPGLGSINYLNARVAFSPVKNFSVIAEYNAQSVAGPEFQSLATVANAFGSLDNQSVLLRLQRNFP